MWLYGDVGATREGSSQRRGRHADEAWASPGLAELDFVVTSGTSTAFVEEIASIRTIASLAASNSSTLYIVYNLMPII